MTDVGNVGMQVVSLKKELTHVTNITLVQDGNVSDCHPTRCNQLVADE